MKPIENINARAHVGFVVRREAGSKGRMLMYSIRIVMTDGRTPYYELKPCVGAWFFRFVNDEQHLKRTIRTNDVSWVLDVMATDIHEVFIESGTQLIYD